MVDALASSLVDALLGFELGGTARDASNRFSFEGVTLRPAAGGALEIGVRNFEVRSLRLASGPLVVEIGRVALRGLVAQVRIEEGVPRLIFAEAAGAELSAVEVHGPVMFPGALPTIGGTAADDASEEGWSLGPLAAMDGDIRAEIVDAQLLFDADVTMPIRRGAIDFNAATVEHVGPDSSMGVSRLGIYVDAPTGRSYIYQFAATPIAGVQFEQRNGWLGARVADRGNLQLQPFAEGLLRQAPRGSGAGFTEEARQLLERTCVSGDVQLADGRLSAPGLKANLVGRADGRNAVRMHSKAVGRGVTVELKSLSVEHAVLTAGAKRVDCEAITGALVLRVLLKGTELRFELDVPKIEVSGLRVRAGGARSV